MFAIIRSTKVKYLYDIVEINYTEETVQKHFTDLSFEEAQDVLGLIEYTPKQEVSHVI